MDDELLHLYIFRDHSLELATLGRFFNPNDEYSCYSLELPDLDNAPNISCIPEGIYIAERDYYNRGGYACFELRDVPSRSEIKIHIGNYPKDVLGCVVLGTRRVIDPPMVANSKNAFNDFMKYMEGVDRFKLEIRGV